MRLTLNRRDRPAGMMASKSVDGAVGHGVEAFVTQTRVSGEEYAIHR